jgi:threonylcarbamoyladenosine tRNA methylthiotransferase MtaB
MHIHFDFLGCRLNEAEVARWKRQLTQYGHRWVNHPQDADIIVLNTCAVTGEASKKSRQKIRRLGRKNPAAGMVVTGCYATLEPQKMAKELHVNLVVPNKSKDQLIQQISTHFDIPLSTPLSIEPEAQPAFAQTRTRAFIKVQDGCHNRCSFCIVSKARGAERSIPLHEICKEIIHLQELGFQEVILTGVHLGGYGREIGSSLTELIQTILKETSIPRVRIGSLEPWELDADFFCLFSDPRLCPHLHLPMQSGSNSVLKRMIRKYTVLEYQGLVQQARSISPNIQISTDLIVGFPGETEEEFSETLNTLHEIQFGDMHIFRYSPREGTAAARLPRHVPKNIAVERFARVLEIKKESQSSFHKGLIGQNRAVLWERDAQKINSGLWLWKGYTDNYVRIKTMSTQSLFNQITSVSIESIDEGTLYGSVLHFQNENAML